MLGGGLGKGDSAAGLGFLAGLLAAPGVEGGIRDLGSPMIGMLLIGTRCFSYRVEIDG